MLKYFENVAYYPELKKKSKEEKIRVKCLKKLLEKDFKSVGCKIYFSDSEEGFEVSIEIGNHVYIFDGIFSIDYCCGVTQNINKGE